MSFPRTSTQQSDEDRDIEVEALQFQAADLIAEELAEQGVSRAELARRLGVSAPHITQILSGERNLTLKSLAEALYALGRRVDLNAEPLHEEPDLHYDDLEGNLVPVVSARLRSAPWSSGLEIATESSSRYGWREGAKVHVRAFAHG